MDIDHPNTQLSSSLTGFGYSIGYVMKFKIKKHLKTHVLNLLYEHRSSTSKQFLAYLQTTFAGIQLPNQLKRFFFAIII